MALCTDPFAGQRVLTHSTSSKQKEIKSKLHQLRETEAILGGEKGLMPGWGPESASSLDSSFRSLGSRLSGNISRLQRMTEPSSGTLLPGHTGFPRPLPCSSAGLHPTALRAPNSQSRGNQRFTWELVRRGWHEEQPIKGRGERLKVRGWSWRNGGGCFPGPSRLPGLWSTSQGCVLFRERCCFSSPYNTLFMGFLATVRHSDFTLASVESEGEARDPCVELF